MIASVKKYIKRIFPLPYWLFLSWYKEIFGVFPAVFRIPSLVISGFGSAPHTITGGRVWLRPGTADHDVYDAVFVYNEYAIDLDNPAVILDAGAHIGLSAVYFAAKYPKAHIIAIEAENANYSILKKNAKLFRNITPLHLGLWNKRAKLQLENIAAETWSYRFTETLSDEGTPTVSVLDLISEFNLEKIDVLKLDIEGSEIEVLNHSKHWMHKVGTLIIELHDRFRPGCFEALQSALNGFDYSQTKLGENLIFQNIRPQ